MRFKWQLILLAAISLIAGCERYNNDAAYADPAAITGGGNRRQGVASIRRYGCGRCHTIPGIDGATALVGPSLDHLANRLYVAGELPNTPDNLIRWLEHPRQVLQHTAMPEMGVTEQDGRDIAAYLYTLK